MACAKRVKGYTTRKSKEGTGWDDPDGGVLRASRVGYRHRDVGVGGSRAGGPPERSHPARGAADVGAPHCRPGGGTTKDCEHVQSDPPPRHDGGDLVGPGYWPRDALDTRCTW